MYPFGKVPQSKEMCYRNVVVGSGGVVVVENKDTIDGKTAGSR